MTTRLPRGLDRPIVGVVGLDPARVGPGGLAVLPHPELKPGHVLQHRQGQIVTEATSDWLGDAVAALCRPGERVLLVCEMDAFGPSIARQLGMAVGAMEMLLLDLHAIEPETRVDVSQSTWRKAMYGKVPKGRKLLKQRAVREVEERYGVRMGEDEAEATLIATYGMQLLVGGVHD